MGVSFAHVLLLTIAAQMGILIYMQLHDRNTAARERRADDDETERRLVRGMKRAARKSLALAESEPVQALFFATQAAERLTTLVQVLGRDIDGLEHFGAQLKRHHRILLRRCRALQTTPSDDADEQEKQEEH